MIILKVFLRQLVIKNRKKCSQNYRKIDDIVQKYDFFPFKGLVSFTFKFKISSKMIILDVAARKKIFYIFILEKRGSETLKISKKFRFWTIEPSRFFSRTSTELRIGHGIDQSLVNTIQKELVDGIDSINFYPYDMLLLHICNKSSLTYHTAKIPEELIMSHIT